jgi:hypothetical protein
MRQSTRLTMDPQNEETPGVATLGGHGTYPWGRLSKYADGGGARQEKSCKCKPYETCLRRARR